MLKHGFWSLLAVMTVTSVTAARTSEEALWRRIGSEPHVVLLMRHAATTGNPVAWDASGGCQGEAMLNDDGRDQARRLRAAFESRRLPATVIASPMCRGQHTADLAFPGPRITDPLLRETDSADAERKKAFADLAAALFARHRGRKPIVFISHRPNIYQLVQQPIEYEEIIVATADAKGVLKVIGRVSFK